MTRSKLNISRISVLKKKNSVNIGIDEDENRNRKKTNLKN